MSRWRWAAIASGLAGAAWLVSMALDEYRGMLGPLVASVLPIPFAIWAVSIAVLDARYRRTSALLGILARLSLLAVALAFIAGPDLTIADQAAMLVGARIGDAADGLRRVLAALAGLVVAVGVVASLVAPKQTAPATKRQIGGRGGHPITGIMLRSLVRLALLVAGTVSWLAILTTGWLVLGWWRLRLALAPGSDRDRWVRRALELRGRGLAAGFARVGGAWRARTRGPAHGVWLRPAWLVRSEELELVDERAWERTSTPEDAQLAELGKGLLAAYDVALQAVVRGGDARAPAPRVGPYRLEIARAWSRPDLHAVVLSVTPALAAAVAARVGLDQLVPVLDAVTSWTGDDLRSLHLSDRRIAGDPLREGTVGLFVALDRVPATSVTTDADPVVAAVDRALGEAGLRGRFRMAAREEGIEADTMEYRASFRTSTEWRELETSWKNLAPAVALFAKSQTVRLETRLDPYGFLVVVPKPAPEFPSGEAVDWTRVFERYEPALRRHPLRFVLGLDHRSEPVFLELGHETPHLLVAGGTGSGKSRSAVFSPLLQLLEGSPDHLGVWLLDSVKRELVSLFGDAPHVRHAVVAEDADAVVETIERFAAEMDARYRELRGMEFDPATGQSQLCVVEEFGDIVLLLDKADLERFVRAVTRIGQLGRAAGFHLVLVTQKASAEVLPPRLKSNFKGRVCGFFPNVADYGIVFDEHRRLLPNVKGRLAVTTGSGLVVCQGLYADNETIHRRVRAMRGPRTSTPRPAVAAWPSQADIDRLDDATLLRLLYAWRAADDGELTVTVRGLVEYIRSLGLTPGRVERLTEALARLEGVGVLDRTSSHVTAPRRLAYGSEEEALMRLQTVRAGVEDAA